jgi:hypothetical protein
LIGPPLILLSIAVGLGLFIRDLMALTIKTMLVQYSEPASFAGFAVKALFIPIPTKRRGRTLLNGASLSSGCSLN